MKSTRTSWDPDAQRGYQPTDKTIHEPPSHRKALPASLKSSQPTTRTINPTRRRTTLGDWQSQTCCLHCARGLAKHLNQ
jgi:hypothetical protein